MNKIADIPASEGPDKSNGHDTEGAITIRMYYFDQGPPHVHGIKGRAESILDLDGGTINMACPPAIDILPLPDMTLLVTFVNGVVKRYDAKPLADSSCVFEGVEVFRELLKDEGLFNSARLSPGGCAVIWSESTDLAIEEVWAKGKTVRGRGWPQEHKRMDN